MKSSTSGAHSQWQNSLKVKWLCGQSLLLLLSSSFSCLTWLWSRLWFARREGEDGSVRVESGRAGAAAATGEPSGDGGGESPPPTTSIGPSSALSWSGADHRRFLESADDGDATVSESAGVGLVLEATPASATGDAAVSELFSLRLACRELGRCGEGAERGGRSRSCCALSSPEPRRLRFPSSRRAVSEIWLWLGFLDVVKSVAVAAVAALLPLPLEPCCCCCWARISAAWELVSLCVREMMTSPTMSGCTRRPKRASVRSGSHDDQPCPNTKNGCSSVASTVTCSQKTNFVWKWQTICVWLSFPRWAEQECTCIGSTTSANQRFRKSQCVLGNAIDVQLCAASTLFSYFFKSCSRVSFTWPSSLATRTLLPVDMHLRDGAVGSSCECLSPGHEALNQFRNKCLNSERWGGWVKQKNINFWGKKASLSPQKGDEIYSEGIVVASRKKFGSLKVSTTKFSLLRSSIYGGWSQSPCPTDRSPTCLVRTGAEYDSGMTHWFASSNGTKGMVHNIDAFSWRHQFLTVSTHEIHKYSNLFGNQTKLAEMFRKHPWMHHRIPWTTNPHSIWQARFHVYLNTICHPQYSALFVTPSALNLVN